MAITEKYCTTTGAGAHDGTSEANAWSLTEALTNAAAGHRVNIKAGTYTLAANATPTNAGTVAQPIIWRGYNSTIGDLESVRPSATTGRLDATNFPLIDAGASWKILWSQNYTVLQNINFQSSKNDTVLDITGSRVEVVQCKIRSTGSASSTVALGLGFSGIAIDCDIETTNAGSVCALYLVGQYARAVGCFIKAATNTYAAIWMGSAGHTLTRCIIWATAKDGVMIRNTGNANMIDSCTIYTPSGACIAYDNFAMTELTLIINTTMTDSTRAFDNKNSGTSQRPVVRHFNRTRDNTNADNGADDWPELGRVTTDTGGPTSDFGDLTGGTNYTLSSTSPCKAAGHVPYLDIGCFQRQEPTGAAGIIG